MDYSINLRYAETEKDDIIKVFFDADFFNSFLLLSGTEDYQLLNLGKGKVYDIVGAKIISHKNKNLIQLLSFKTSIVNKDDILKSDTLMIKDNQLTEFTEPKNQHKIEKIIFTQIGGYAPGTEYQLTVQRDSIILKSDYFKNLKGTYFGIADSGFEHLSHDLNDINFNELQDHFSTESNDCPAIQTQIIFNNGKVKTIYDYGERGTLGLAKFYEKIDYLMNHQKWTKIK